MLKTQNLVKVAFMAVIILVITKSEILNEVHSFAFEQNYMCLDSGRYALNLTGQCYWIWIFPKWTSLGLLEKKINSNVLVEIFDSKNKLQKLKYTEQPPFYKNPYTYRAVYTYQSSERHGYALGWTFIDKGGTYFIRYKTEVPSLLVIVPVSNIFNDLGSHLTFRDFKNTLLKPI